MNIEERCKNAEGETAFDIDLDKWKAPKPHGVSGFFRLRNEEEFMLRAVESHLPWLDEAVLVVQPSEDRTEFLARMLEAKHPGKVKVFPYPFDVNFIATPGHFNLPENSVYTMMHLTNYAISCCSYSWVSKIEGDVLALPTFGRIRKAVDQLGPGAPMKYFGRVGLNVAGPAGDLFPWFAPRNAGWDESVFNNDPFWFCLRNDKWESTNHHAHRECLVNFGWSFIHVKRCKAAHQGLKGPEGWSYLTEGNLFNSLMEYEPKHPYPGADAGTSAADVIGMVREAMKGIG